MIFFLFLFKYFQNWMCIGMLLINTVKEVDSEDSIQLFNVNIMCVIFVCNIKSKL